MDVWTLDIQSWVIQDGNFDDFALGQRLSFPVVASPSSVSRAVATDRPRLNRVEHGQYEFTDAVVELVGVEGWVVDFGIQCYGRRPALPDGVRVGDTLSGVARFHLPFPGVHDDRFLAETRRRTYSWRVERIRREISPWVEVEPGSFVRRPVPLGHVDIEATNARDDDELDASYLLDCRLLGRRRASWLAWDRGRSEAMRRARRARHLFDKPGIVILPNKSPSG